ncbi:MAG: archaemetzincin family Zn-dependent metalloprotease [Candidatus Bathyarchaeia archaeon]
MTVKIGILPIGQIDTALLLLLKEKLKEVIPDIAHIAICARLSIPDKSLDKRRMQYRSDVILSKIQFYADKRKNLNSVLGVVDVDIFVPELNFVFGEATCPGKAALISLWRLKPEFYGALSNRELFAERVLKEAVHELGHTFGLKHCERTFCVMHFSNSIFDTDRKHLTFCDDCYMQLVLSINGLE